MEKENEKIKELLGDNLIALLEYQTGGVTNILIICNTLDFNSLKKLKELKKQLFLFTKEELLNGRDVFPIEYLNIKQAHELIYGKDLFKDMEISKKNLRHQLEFEFRSKLIHLREEYLIIYKNKDLEALILSAIPVLIPIIGGLIYLKDLKYSDTDDMFKIVSDGYNIDTSILKEIYDIQKGKVKFKNNTEEYIEKLFNILYDIGKAVDEFEATQ